MAASRDSDKAIRYSVTTTIGSAEGLVDEYVAWLKDGHVQAVVAAGATNAEVLVLEQASGEPVKTVSTYVFPSRAAFDSYVEKTAPALREDGLKRFGGKDVSFSRTIGTCVFAHST